MSTEIRPGKYHASVVDYGISATKNGQPMVNVKFQFGEHSLIWYGSMNEGKALEITMKTLLTLGLSSAEKVADLALGAVAKVLDTDKQVEIDVQPDTYDGKTTLKIKWVNEIGFKNTMSKEEFKAKLATMNIRGSFALAKENLGSKPVAKMTEAQVIENIPF